MSHAVHALRWLPLLSIASQHNLLWEQQQLNHTHETANKTHTDYYVMPYAQNIFFHSASMILQIFACVAASQLHTKFEKQKR